MVWCFLQGLGMAPQHLPLACLPTSQPAHTTPPTPCTPAPPARPHPAPLCSNCRARLQQHNSRRRKVFAMTQELRKNKFVEQDWQLVDLAGLSEAVAAAAGLPWPQRQTVAAAAAAAAGAGRPALEPCVSLQPGLHQAGGLRPQHGASDSSAAALAAALVAAGGALESMAAEQQQQQQQQPQWQGRQSGELLAAWPPLRSHCRMHVSMQKTKSSGAVPLPSADSLRPGCHLLSSRFSVQAPSGPARAWMPAAAAAAAPTADLPTFKPALSRFAACTAAGSTPQVRATPAGCCSPAWGWAGR